MARVFITRLVEKERARGLEEIEIQRIRQGQTAAANNSYGCFNMLGAPEGDGFTHQATSHVHVSLTGATACFLDGFDAVGLVGSNRKYKQNVT